MSIENAIGFGVLRDGRPRGLWPATLEWCGTRKERWDREARDDYRLGRINSLPVHTIVPIFTGMPVSYHAPVVTDAESRDELA